jgi:hypothetical protein
VADEPRPVLALEGDLLVMGEKDSHDSRTAAGG